MAQTLTIQVTIGNRSYPLTVAEEEKDHVLKAAQKINDDLKEFEEKYKIKDQQDLLAMFSLQMVTDHQKNSVNHESLNKEVDKGLQHLNILVEEYLGK
jgi:cell division protein ZapA (FtsZ GTPase activity inhibitor)